MNTRDIARDILRACGSIAIIGMRRGLYFLKSGPSVVYVGQGKSGVLARALSHLGREVVFWSQLRPVTVPMDIDGLALLEITAECPFSLDEAESYFIARLDPRFNATTKREKRLILELAKSDPARFSRFEDWLKTARAMSPTAIPALNLPELQTFYIDARATTPEALDRLEATLRKLDKGGLA